MSCKYTHCNECFYAFQEDTKFPCNRCDKYDYFIHKDVYTESQPNTAWERVVEGLNGLSKDDWPDFKDSHDVVNKPRHYMLFKSSDVTTYSLTGRGIEVRDVIEKLVNKVMGHTSKAFAYKSASLFESDYVQMMQYLMRFMDKNGVEDLKKARWYLDKLIEAYDA